MTSATESRTTELTSTDRLRAMLDERGVEYETDDRNAITKWSTYYGAFVFFARQREGKLLVETTVAIEHSVILTPEQAIAATLGGGKLTANDVLNAVYKHGARWQEIADELNATLGSGTCELVETDRYTNYRETIHVLECSECGETCEHVNGSYPRCPHCGRKAVKR